MGRGSAWTQWAKADVAEKHVHRLLKDHRHAAGRVVRVDWTVVAEMNP